MADAEVVALQLGRPPRGLQRVAHRCPCGLPDVVETAPRLADGTPFPTLYYLTCPRAVAAMSRLEAAGVMRQMQRRLAEFAEQLQGQQQLAWADNAIKLAVELTVAAVNRVNLQGDVEQQAQQIRSVIAIVFPEAVTLVREARQGLQ